jgi:hypothetical protein
MEEISMNPIFEWLLILAVDFVIFQLTYFFYFDTGRIQKWRFRNAVDRVLGYINDNTAEGHPPCEVSFIYKNKKFNVGVIKKTVNYHYTKYLLFINGEDVATYHCLKHDTLNTYYFEKTSRRDPSEIIKIFRAASKHLKRLEKETTEKRIPEWKADSYFK